MGNEYSSLKMAWWAQREGFPPAAPKQVQLIISDLCNQDCSFCAYRMSGYSSNEMFLGDSKQAAYGTNNPVRFIPTERCLAFLDEFKRAGVLAVQFTGGGEPTVHQDHERIFARAVETGLKASLVSNGLRWSDRLIADILPRFAWVRVSVDAGNATTYASIRRTPADNFHKVIRHVGRLADAIKLAGSSCTLGVGYVVTPENYKEIDSGIAVAKGTGARYIRLSAMFNPEGEAPYANIYPAIKADITEARLRYDSPAFSVVDLFGERLADLHDGAPDYRTCSYQHYTSYVGGDMRAYRCCVLAYNHRGLVDGGKDLEHTPWDVFWASEERVNDFERFDAHGCERCQFNPKNRAMSYLLDKSPGHVEFP